MNTSNNSSAKQQAVQKQSMNAEQLSNMKRFSFDDLANSTIPERKWLVKGLIPEGGKVMFTGYAGSSKSFFALNLAVHLATGTHLFGRIPLQQSEVLYLDLENHLADLKARATKFANGISKQVPQGSLDFSVFEEMKLHQKSVQIMSQILKPMPKVIIVDSLVRFFVGDENESKDAKELFKILRMLTGHLDVTWIILHHAGKGRQTSIQKSARGSSEFSAMVDFLYKFDKLSDVDFQMTLGKERRKVDSKNLAYEIFEDDSTLKLIEKVAAPVVPKKSKMDSFIEGLVSVTVQGEVFTRKDLVELGEDQEISESTVKRAIRKMLQKGILEEGDKHNELEFIGQSGQTL